jgi:hypothetical protein
MEDVNPPKLVEARQREDERRRTSDMIRASGASERANAIPEPSAQPSPQPSPGGRGRRTDDAALPFSSREKGPGDEGRPASTGRPTRRAAKTAKPPWPKTMPEQIAAVRDLVLASDGTWTAEAVARSFKHARASSAETVLDSLSAIGVLIALDGEGESQWKGAGR